MKFIKSTIIVTIPVPDQVAKDRDLAEKLQEKFLTNKLFSNDYTVLDVTSKVVEEKQ